MELVKEGERQLGATGEEEEEEEGEGDDHPPGPEGLGPAPQVGRDGLGRDGLEAA